VGKYVALPDAYLSVIESLKHAGVHHNLAVDIRWVSSEKLDAGDTSPLMGVAGIVVPGGFGYRGIEGKVQASRYARHNRIPYLGLCLGMQCAVIDFAREALDAPDANSTEFAAFTSTPVIDLMPEQKERRPDGRLDAPRPVSVQARPGFSAHKAYGEEVVYERHRHRFEFNNEYRESLGEAGMVFSGVVAERAPRRDRRAGGPPLVRGDAVSIPSFDPDPTARTRCFAIRACGVPTKRASTRWSSAR